jgi:hypothetical protein
MLSINNYYRTIKKEIKIIDDNSVEIDGQLYVRSRIINIIDLSEKKIFDSGKNKKKRI